MDFPGRGTVYISQNSAFKRPAYVNTMVDVEVKVTQVIPEKRRLVLETNILNEKGMFVSLAWRQSGCQNRLFQISEGCHYIRGH